MQKGTVTTDPVTWPDFLKMYWKNGEDAAPDVVKYYSQFVSDEFRPIWMSLHDGWYLQGREFLKHPEWKLHSKSKDGTQKMYIRVSSSNFLCLKSMAIVNESL